MTIFIRNLFVTILICFSVQVCGQKTNRHTPLLQKGFYLSINPHSLLEPEQGAAGIGVGYRISKRFEVWSELNYLYKGFFTDAGKLNGLKGFRSITSFKYFYNNKYGFFIGVEFRLKKYAFDDRYTFVNESANDTLTNYPYRAEHLLMGAGIFWGKRFKLSANGKFELEGNIGIGAKQRVITRNALPGYEPVKYFVRDVNGPVPDRNIEQGLVYFPAAFRFIYHL